ncbi:hypothetical protein PC115_g4378 [Phytophthora cactorum]|uniref:Uncharacterized protein n=1 Tax=Phytophthora cactorum TaxID=29920 RepID=A0A8T1DAZ0_9STRA|nr:hypothetical protein PC115_g4378 [Phytophthora cactorum]KAG2950290.1 hypothetical protein PC117_g4556 [Phytophthora cactorum]
MSVSVWASRQAQFERYGSPGRRIMTQHLPREDYRAKTSCGKPVAAPKLTKRFFEDYEISISVRSLRRVLRRMVLKEKGGQS